MNHPSLTWRAAVVVGAALCAAACRSQMPPSSYEPPNSGSAATGSAGSAPAGSAPAAAAPPAPAAVSPQEGGTAPIAPSIAFTAPPPAYTGPLPPLPTAPFPAARPADVVQAVYAFAARHPEVLHYVPCFCGCQNAGHSDNDDCFISKRDASGRPTWEPHGMT